MRAAQEVVLRALSQDANTAAAVSDLATQLQQSNTVTIAGMKLPWETAGGVVLLLVCCCCCMLIAAAAASVYLE